MGNANAVGTDDWKMSIEVENYFLFESSFVQLPS